MAPEVGVVLVELFQVRASSIQVSPPFLALLCAKLFEGDTFFGEALGDVDVDIRVFFVVFLPGIVTLEALLEVLIALIGLLLGRLGGGVGWLGRLGFARGWGLGRCFLAILFIFLGKLEEIVEHGEQLFRVHLGHIVGIGLAFPGIGVPGGGGAT